MNSNTLASYFPDWELLQFKNEAEIDLTQFKSEKIFIVCDELSSTRASVKSWGAIQLAAFKECIVLALKQTAGEGRLDRSWYAEAEASLTFNYLSSCDPSIHPGHLSLLSAWAQWKVFNGLYGIHGIDLKWPNDVLLNEKKCTGSLMEILPDANNPKLSLGLGVNVGKMEFPTELKSIATSLMNAGVELPCREQVLADLIECFRQGLKFLDEPKRLIDDYNSASSFVKGARLEYLQDEKRCSGISAGLSESGGLWIQDEQGAVREYHGSEIQKVRKQ